MYGIELTALGAWLGVYYGSNINKKKEENFIFCERNETKQRFHVEITTTLLLFGFTMNSPVASSHLAAKSIIRWCISA